MKTTRTRAGLLVAGLMTALGAGLMAAPFLAVADATPMDKVGVCHANSADTPKPYVWILVNGNSTDFQGHLDHRNEPNKTWKSAGTWNGTAHKAGDPKRDYIAAPGLDAGMTEAICEGTPATTTPPPTTTTAPPTTTEPGTTTAPPTTTEPGTTTAPPTTTEPGTTTAPPTTTEPATTLPPTDPATSTKPGTTPATGQSIPTTGGSLPRTGGEVGVITAIGLLLLVGGAAAMLATRRTGAHV